ncbi:MULTISPECIES: GumC family protein [Bradyrhizobium]|jgi:uncharacterized protein involved in exopolysaccharide biosynthesis|uniref:GumC family protein n=1 Tax=Bradyrhizobium TaxID=374 RepID=UPI00041C73F0|nr:MULTISPECIES: GumC family protein [Bradyrhizobium]
MVTPIDPRSSDDAMISLASAGRTLLDGAATILLCGIAAVLLAAFYLVAVPAKYEATTEILFDPRGLKAVQNELVSRSENNDSSIALLESQMRVIRSETVLRAVVERLDLEHDPEFVGGRGLFASLTGLFRPNTKSEPADIRALRSLQRIVRVDRASRSYVVAISAVSRDPNKAPRITDGVANAYIEEDIRARAEAAKRVSASMTSRLHELASRVQEAENNAERFKRENNLIGTNRGFLGGQQLEELSTQLTQARAVTVAQRARLDQIQNAIKAGGDVGTISEAVQSPVIAQLRAQYAEIVRQEGSATALLGDRNPEVAVIRQRLQQHKKLIAEELSRISAAARNDYERAVENEKVLSTNLDALKAKASTAAEAMVRMRELDRVVEANRAIYEAFLVRAKELAEQENVDTANTRIIAPALAPDKPTTPRTSLMIAALLAGLACGAALVMLRRYSRVSSNTTAAGRRI